MREHPGALRRCAFPIWVFGVGLMMFQTEDVEVNKYS